MDLRRSFFCLGHRCRFAKTTGVSSPHRQKSLVQYAQKTRFRISCFTTDLIITTLLRISQGVVTAATGAGLTLILRRAFTTNPGISSGTVLLQGESTTVMTATPPAPPPPPPPPPQADAKPAHDVVAGAVARAASQSTIHPLDTMKVRMQAGNSVRGNSSGAKTVVAQAARGGFTEVRGLYKGVVGAATGAGVIIGTYFAFYSTTKRFLREQTNINDGAAAFVAGATAALGSSVVKVPLAVCIRSVQAGVYKNVFHASKSIISAAGVRGLFTGFVPTVLEDVPDMAVKFAAYETLRKLHDRLKGGRPANVMEDLVMGGFAGAAAAAATTPLDVVKTVMMCTASSRPTLLGAARSIMQEGKGLAPFFRGVGPRALSNGLNSAIFFCCFEAIRQVLVKRQERIKSSIRVVTAATERGSTSRQRRLSRFNTSSQTNTASVQAPRQLRPAGSVAACLSLALPVSDWRESTSYQMLQTNHDRQYRPSLSLLIFKSPVHSR